MSERSCSSSLMKGFAILRYLRLFKDALRSGKKKEAVGLLYAWYCVGPLGFYGWQGSQASCHEMSIWFSREETYCIKKWILEGWFLWKRDTQCCSRSTAGAHSMWTKATVLKPVIELENWKYFRWEVLLAKALWTKSWLFPGAPSVSRDTEGKHSGCNCSDVYWPWDTAEGPSPDRTASHLFCFWGNICLSFRMPALIWVF